MQLTKMHGIAITSSRINWCWSIDFCTKLCMIQIVKFDDSPWFDSDISFERHCGVLNFDITLFKLNFHLEWYS